MRRRFPEKVESRAILWIMTLEAKTSRLPLESCHSRILQPEGLLGAVGTAALSPSPRELSNNSAPVDITS